MQELSIDQRRALGRLIESLPESALQTLEATLAALGSFGFPRAVVQAALDDRAEQTAACRAVFAPLLPLCAPHPLDGVPGLLAADTPALLWNAARRAVPELCEPILTDLRSGRTGAILVAHDDLCRTLAAELRSGADPVFADVAAPCGRLPGGAGLVADLLDLSPSIRKVSRSLEVWAHDLTREAAFALRCAYQDAAKVSETGGALFMTALGAHLAEPWRVIRLVSAVMNRPSAGLLAASDLGPLAGRVVSDIERRIKVGRAFDPREGAEAGRATAATLSVATLELAEFEQWIATGGEGAERLAEQRRALVQTAEGHLRDVERAVRAALPTEPAQLSGRVFHQVPRLSSAPDPEAARRAQGLIGLLTGLRRCAVAGGFSALRDRVAAALDAQLEDYAEHALKALHRSPADQQARARAFLTVAADLVAHATDTAAGHVLRRRAAAA